jgi:Zn-dependent membrane protease YugP
MFFFYNSNYIILMIATLAISLFAQWWVRSAFQKASQIPNHQRITGAQAARQILDNAGLSYIPIQPTQSVAPRMRAAASPSLDDHYDPRAKALFLSPAVYGSASVAALGVAAHEVGHAIQDAQGYAPMRWRSSLVPAASIGSNLGIWLVILGLIMQFSALAWLGVAAFALGALFALLTLPVELNASSRAMQTLTNMGLVDRTEYAQAKSVLRAAAFTYVAGLAVAVLNLLYWLSLVSGMGGSRRS